MGAGWLYYHRYPPKRKCPLCGKRQYLKLVSIMSNGADVWVIKCPCVGRFGKKLVTSDGYEN